MAAMPADDPSEVTRSLERAAQGEGEAWQVLLRRHHARLRRMIAVRLDPRLNNRLDPDDVLQEIFLDAFRQLPDYLRDRRYPFFLWLRLLTGHWLTRTHRHHLGTQA